MTLFSRSRGRPERPVADFWSWWASGGRDQALAAENGDGTDHLARAMTKRIGAIGSGLEWEFGAHGASGHSLTLSASGVPSSRMLAQYWWGARPADPAWTFYPARQPARGRFDASIQIDGADLRLGDLGYRIREDDEARRVHVTVVHPGFDEIDPRAALQVAFLSLDWLLGEDDVTRWIGEVTTDAAVIDGTGTRQRLIDTVTALEMRRDPESRRVAEFETDGGGRFAGMVRDWTRWIDRPELDTLHEIDVPFRMADGSLPHDEADRLASWEDRLEEAIADRGLQVVHLSSAGHRTFYVYVRSDDSEVSAALHGLVRGTPGARKRAMPDPGWDRIRAFTG